MPDKAQHFQIIQTIAEGIDIFHPDSETFDHLLNAGGLGAVTRQHIHTQRIPADKVKLREPFFIRNLAVLRTK
ncbi:hypothetical protein D3C73_1505470 [compost metagenome]